jgi:hypothetical protein
MPRYTKEHLQHCQSFHLYHTAYNAMVQYKVLRQYQQHFAKISELVWSNAQTIGHGRVGYSKNKLA